ncbi:InlB B-repeat-containing protein, partial [Rheinheimera riviphila]|uniref:InlB B-repeat-containing protein n=1 Tax=Rheinheimera riviphila TaxID=1834037 RepID=UPI001981C830
SPSSRSVVQGSSTSFTVTANSGYTINGVSGCGGSLSGTTFTTAAINAACTVSATFVANPVIHTVTANAGAGGSVSPSSRSVVQG